MKKVGSGFEDAKAWGLLILFFIVAGSAGFMTYLEGVSSNGTYGSGYFIGTLVGHGLLTAVIYYGLLGASKQKTTGLVIGVTIGCVVLNIALVLMRMR